MYQKTSPFSFIINFIFCLICLFTANAQKVKVNTLVPDFEFKQQLSNKISASKLSDLKGKFVLIDFWATWCKPCTKTMPYIDKVKEQFGDTLVVLAVSDETPEEIDMFLKGKTIGSTIVVDAGSKITKLFAVDAIPHSVLIGADGKLKLIGAPTSITPKAIRSVMNDQVIEIVRQIPPEKVDELLGKTQKGIKTSVDITPYNPLKPTIFKEIITGEYANRRLYFANMTIKAIYENLYHMPNRGVLRVPSLEKYNDGAEASNLYCVDIIVRKEEASNKFKVAIEEMHRRFGLKSRMEYITLMTKVLEVDNQEYLPLKATYNITDAEASTFEQLANAITTSNSFGMPVLNETNLPDRYLIAFKQLPEDPAQIIALLRSKGIKITEKIQQIPTLVLYE